MNPPKAGREEGKRAALYFGAEAQENNCSFQDYDDSIAAYYGHEKFDDMPDELRLEARQQFRAGQERERKIKAQYRNVP